MTAMNAITTTEATARKLFGEDISIMVARAPMYGDSDTCIIIINGKRHADASRAFLVAKPTAKVAVETGRRFRTGQEYTYTTVTF